MCLGDLRLVSGGVLPLYSGYLQLFRNNQWGNIAICNFASVDANVACFQLFGDRKHVAIEDYESFWVPNNQPVLFTSFACVGTEDNLADCPYNYAEMAVQRCNDPDDAVFLTCDVGGRNAFFFKFWPRLMVND